MQEISDGFDVLEDEKYEEEWEVIMSTKGKYTLSKAQARALMNAMAQKERVVIFQSFTIPVSFVAEFYRTRRYLKGAKALPAQATEPEFKPVDPERLAKMKKEIYEKLGKKMPK